MTKREYNIDLLKILATYLVIILHSACSGVGYKVFDISLFIYYIGGFAVPLFFMINGYLQLQKQNDYKYVFHKIMRIL